VTEENYKQLVAIYNNYNADGLEILAFPSNQFGAQEPGSPNDIRSFVDKFGVHFHMMEKIDVNGHNTSSVYCFLKRNSHEGDIRWNFATKFLVDPQGLTLRRFDGCSFDDLEAEIATVLATTNNS